MESPSATADPNRVSRHASHPAVALRDVERHEVRDSMETSILAPWSGNCRDGGCLGEAFSGTPLPLGYGRLSKPGRSPQRLAASDDTLRLGKSTGGWPSAWRAS